MASLTKIKIGAWVASPAQNLLENGERSIKIEPRTMNLLAYLAAHPGEVVSVDELFAAVWPGVVVGDSSVYVAINQLRRALTAPGDDTDYIETIPKRGYRLTAPVEILASQRTPPAARSPAAGNGHGTAEDPWHPPVESGAPPTAATGTASGGAAAHFDHPAAAAAGDKSPTQWKWRLRFAAGAVGLCLIAAFAFVSLQPEPPSVRTRVRAEISLEGHRPGQVTISPDGQYLAYVALASGGGTIWLRRTDDALKAVSLPGTTNALGLFWSLDSRYLAFTAGDKLWKVDVRAGGQPAPVADAPRRFSTHGSWGGNDTILYTTPSGDIGHVTAGGAINPIEGLRADAAACDHPFLRAMTQMLPDGDRFLYVSVCDELGFELSAGSVSGRAPIHLTTITRAPSRPEVGMLRMMTPSVAYADGFLLWLLDRNLQAQPFDLEALSVYGETYTLAENVGEFSVSSTGVLVYLNSETFARPPPPQQSRRLVLFDRSGRRIREVAVPGAYIHPRLSPNGQQIALAVSSPRGSVNDTTDIVAVNVEDDTPRRVTSDVTMNAGPVWSTNGEHIVFAAGPKEMINRPSLLYRRPADGSGSDELLLSAMMDEFTHPWDWSHDGQHVLFARGRLATYSTRSDIWVLSMSSPPAAYPLVASRSVKRHARFSPTDRWIAYSSNDTGSEEVVVQAFPSVADGGPWQISIRGGTEPRWRNDGREIVYLAPDGMLMSVAVDTTGDRFTWETPQPLFATGLRVDEWPLGQLSYYFDMAGDGQTFLVNELLPTPPPQPAQPPLPRPQSIQVVVNWSAGLER